MPPPIFVRTSSRDHAELLAWSLVTEDVRLTFEVDDWGVCVSRESLDPLRPARSGSSSGRSLFAPSLGWLPDATAALQ